MGTLAPRLWELPTGPPACRRSPRHRGPLRVPLGSSRRPQPSDRKSTRLNSSHTVISYAVFCLKKKNEILPVGSCSGGGCRLFCLLLHIRSYPARHSSIDWGLRRLSVYVHGQHLRLGPTVAVH